MNTLIKKENKKCIVKENHRMTAYFYKRKIERYIDLIIYFSRHLGTKEYHFEY